jgi:ankyrin repeat protein
MTVVRLSLVDLAENGAFQELKQELDSGVDINGHSSDGRVALHAAFAESHEEMVRYLLTRGADPNLVDASGYTALHWAARSNDVRMLELAHRAAQQDVDVTDNEGRTPLSWVSQGNDVVALAWLLAQGADPNRVDRDGWGPLHYAAADGNVEAIELLLARGARPLLRLPPNEGEEYGPLASDLARHFARQKPRAVTVLEAAEAGGSGPQKV